MARIQGIDLPNEKEVWTALTYLYGIGPVLARKILEKVGIQGTVRVRDLSDEEVSRIVTEIDTNYVVEGQLRRTVAVNIQRLKDINCYRGTRHKRNLPARGQRTRTNARTRKGPRKTVATKKSIKAMR